MQTDPLWIFTQQKKEKLEIARLQSEYDKAMDLYGSQWNSEVSACYVRLADYKKELALKYVSKQGKLVKLNGETEELAKKSTGRVYKCAS